MFFPRTSNDRRTLVGLNILAYCIIAIHSFQDGTTPDYPSNYGRIVPFFDATFNSVTPFKFNLKASYHVPKSTVYVLSYPVAMKHKTGSGLNYRSTPYLGYPRGILPVLILMNLLAGDISLNPGPRYADPMGTTPAKPNIRKRGRKPKWPCGICNYACSNDCIMCSSCERWFHNKCSGASDDTLDHHVSYIEAVWLCPLCNSVNLSS